jgi:uncharacterized protein YggE
VTARPDQVKGDIGVTTQAQTSQRAASDNAARVAQVDRIHRFVATAATTNTASYSARPEYRYPREGKEPEMTGYGASNIGRVTASPTR